MQVVLSKIPIMRLCIQDIFLHSLVQLFFGNLQNKLSLLDPLIIMNSLHYMR